MKNIKWCYKCGKLTAWKKHKNVCKVCGCGDLE